MHYVANDGTHTKSMLLSLALSIKVKFREVKYTVIS